MPRRAINTHHYLMANNNESYISRLIYRRLLGTITPEENARLDSWLSEREDNRRFFDSLTDSRSLADAHMAHRVIDPLRPALDMERRISHKRRRMTVRRLSRAAAVLIILLATAATLWYFAGHTSFTSPIPSDAPAPLATVPATIEDITAGTTRATITNSSGQTIELTSDASGHDGSSHFLASTPPSTIKPEQLRLDVPRGGEFKIILEDSTEVWLNSESSLRYPETFSGNERRVAVTGEAYFHVRKDPDRPFYVESQGQVIRVYGTTFNIRAYSDETATYTTLETGSISLRSSNSSGEIFLSKGHQAILNRLSDNVSMTVVDPAIVTSWRNGRFVFEDQPLERIMRDLSRWYDFKYEFADDTLRSRIFMGSIPRYADFRTAIQILENCGGIRFTLTPDRKILISSTDTAH